MIMMRFHLALAAALTLPALTLSAPALAAPVAERSILTLEGARAVVAAAETEAVKRGLKVTITVVDFAGYPIAVARMDDATTVGAEIAMAKARTAASFNAPTVNYEQRLQKEGQLRLLTMPVMAVEGGIPIKVKGRTVGAVGVSGATSQEDGLVAAAGVAALAGTADKP